MGSTGVADDMWKRLLSLGFVWCNKLALRAVGQLAHCGSHGERWNLLCLIWSLKAVRLESGDWTRKAAGSWVERKVSLHCLS